MLDSDITAMSRKSVFGIRSLLLVPVYLFSLTAESSSWLIKPQKISPFSSLCNNGIRIQSDIWLGFLIIHDFTHKVISKAGVTVSSVA